MASQIEEKTRQLETIEEKENCESATVTLDDQSKRIPSSSPPQKAEVAIENTESFPRQSFCTSSPMRSKFSRSGSGHYQPYKDIKSKKSSFTLVDYTRSQKIIRRSLIHIKSDAEKDDNNQGDQNQLVSPSRKWTKKIASSVMVGLHKVQVDQMDMSSPSKLFKSRLFKRRTM